jgi:hypothetical protein
MAGLGSLAAVARLPLFALVFFAIGLLPEWPVWNRTCERYGWAVLPLAACGSVVRSVIAGAGVVADAARFLVRRDRWLLPALASFLALAAGLQVASGAYSADFCGHPDESAHFVTSIMVSEYLDSPLQDPLGFAARYYLQYPKLGIGHWPPLGYAIAGVWLHGSGISRAAILVLLLLFAVISAGLIYELLWLEAGRALAVAAAAAWLASGCVQRSYEQAMMDLPAAAACLLALLAFRGYLDRPNSRASILFGSAAGGALMIKQQALVLVLLPLMAVLIGRRLDLLRRGDFWLAAMPPLLIAGPWYTLTTPVFYTNLARWAGFAGQGSASNVSWSFWWETGGLPISTLSAMGLLAALMYKRTCELLWASVFLSSIACIASLRAINEERHVLFGFAARLALTAATMARVPPSLRPMLAVALVGMSWSWQRAPHRGYTAVASIIESGPGGHVLLSSWDEGAIVAAAAAVHPKADVRRFWLRSSKLLANVGWSGKIFDVYVKTVQDVTDILNNNGINQVYLETEDVRPTPVFTTLLGRALDEAPGAWQPIDLPIAGSKARLFRRRNPLPARPVSLFVPRLRRTIGGDDLDTTQKIWER